MPADGSTFLAPIRFQPTEASLAKVREMNRQALELVAYAQSPEGQRQRAAMRVTAPVQPIRSATEAEIVQMAHALDAGAILNPRAWMDRFAVDADPQKDLRQSHAIVRQSREAVAERIEANRERNERTSAALAATGGDKLAALGLMLGSER